MKSELIYLNDADAIAASQKLEKKQEARRLKLLALGAKTTEGVFVEDEQCKSVINGQD